MCTKKIADPVTEQMFSNAACQKIKCKFAKPDKKICNNIFDSIRNKILNLFL